MVSIYRAHESKPKQRAGYEARYFADISFREPVDSCGMILVTLEPGSNSSPHGHEHLEEVFMALTNIRVKVDEEMIDLEDGDVLVVEPGDSPARLLAMKFPNLKDDKIVPNRGN